MPDSYHLPALVLTVLLLPAFLQLHLRFRDIRTRLWFLGILFTVLRMIQTYPYPGWDFSNAALHPWIAAAAESASQISAVLFLAALSPLGFRFGGKRVLYAVPFVFPLIVFAFLLDGVYRGAMPNGYPFLLFPTLGGLALLAGCVWGYGRATLPKAVGLGMCIVLGGTGLWICVRFGGVPALVFVVCAIRLTTAMLIFYVFRRVTAGTVLASLGFVAWSLRIGGTLPPFIYRHLLLPEILVNRIVILSVVVVGIGLIMIELEDEVAIKEAAQEREQRAHKELDAYTWLILPRRRVDDFDHQAVNICQAVRINSRFSQVALALLQNSGQYHLMGTAGLNDATVNALEALTLRIPAGSLLAPGSASPVVEHSQTFDLDLQPYMLPGDDLTRLRLTKVLAIPLYGRSATEGALFLAGLRDDDEPVSAIDLLPIEVLASRIQAARNQTMMVEKLVDAEKFVGLGQLAGTVTRQLNNPLTVILGYASLLEETENLNSQARKGVEAILTEARHMRVTLESLARMSRPKSDQPVAISVAELLTDLEQLHRSEFVHRSIDFRVHIAPALPPIVANAQQVRQAVLYCLQFAMDAVEKQDTVGERTVRLEASAENGQVQITVAHTGPSFPFPARAFDAFVPEQASSETSGMGLSMCASLIRENNGRASAVNFEPTGAGIVLELKAA